MTELQPSIPGSSTSLQDRQQASRSTIPNIPPDHNAPEQQLQKEVDWAEFEEARAANEQALRDSREGVWFLKEITFNGQRKKIVTQNYNGPCSFIAICNILILRGDIQILPYERTSISYDILAQLVGEYLLRTSPDVDLSAALTMMPLTQKGMDLNPLFTSPTAFRPHGDNGALKLFEQANIPLVHGWLADPSSPEYSALSQVEDYDSAVNLIVEADNLTKGQLVMDENAPGPSSAGPSSSASGSGYQTHMHVSDNWATDDKRKVEDAMAVRNFLDSTGSQLTYHGLFTLASSIKPGSLVALFRNSHLSVLHRRSAPPLPSSSSSNHNTHQDPSSTNSSLTPSSKSKSKAKSEVEVDVEPGPQPESGPEAVSDDPALYNLVTDYVFHNEPSVVWERLEDVDGASSTFVDSKFRRSAPVGGDFAGAILVEQHDSDAGALAEFDPADHELARALQAEEDARAQEAYARRFAQQHRGGGRYPNPQFDPRDPRYAAYMQQQQYVQQQQQLQGQYPQGPYQNGSGGQGQGGGQGGGGPFQGLQGPGQGQGQGHGQSSGGGGGSHKPFKIKKKSSCVVM